MSVAAADWSFPTSIRFGPDRLGELAGLCRLAGVSRPLVVCDPVVADLDFTARALRLLEDEGLTAALFSAVRPNPVSANVEDAVTTLRKGGHDGVVALGGGSAMDVGKVAAFMAGQTRPMWDFEDIGDWWQRADPSGILPIVAVPTTAGTGSEVGRAGVITDEASHTKKVIFHPQMMPKQVILDPQLTVALPSEVTAGTGMDAFAHCLEAYCAPSFHPLAEGIAVEGMRLVREALPQAHADGNNLEARGKMLVAASMGAVAFQKGLGGIHALSHPVGALYDTPHGTTNAVFMPYVLMHNRPAIVDKIVRLSEWLGIRGGFDGFLEQVLEMREQLSIPHTLAELGVDDSRFDDIPAMAVVDPTAGGNPVKLTEADCRNLLMSAHEGTLA